MICRELDLIFRHLLIGQIDFTLLALDLDRKNPACLSLRSDLLEIITIILNLNEFFFIWWQVLYIQYCWVMF